MYVFLVSRNFSKVALKRIFKKGSIVHFEKVLFYKESRSHALLWPSAPKSFVRGNTLVSLWRRTQQHSGRNWDRCCRIVRRHHSRQQPCWLSKRVRRFYKTKDEVLIPEMLPSPFRVPFRISPVMRHPYRVVVHSETLIILGNMSLA